MPTFDETLVKYWENREQLRKLQGMIQKKKNEHAALAREIDKDIRAYNKCRQDLLDAQSDLVPELNKEVQAHPVLEFMKKNASDNKVQSVSKDNNTSIERVDPPVGDAVESAKESA